MKISVLCLLVLAGVAVSLGQAAIVSPADAGSTPQHLRRQTRSVSVYETEERRPKYPPAGYMGLKNIGYFKAYLDTKVTWSTARHQCNEDGGHLSTVNTTRKTDFIRGLTYANGYWLWIDAYEAGDEGVYYNAFGQRWSKPYNLEWNSGYPHDPTGSSCLHIYITAGSVELQDSQCEYNKYYFICEIPWYWD